MVGTTFGRYVIQNEIGRGGMGVVYCARDIKLNRLVAIKVLGRKLQSNPAAWGIVLREAQYASALNHPCICTIYDVGEEEEKPYIAMEYVAGCALNVLLMPSGLDPTLVAHISRQIASALAHAHECGILHRDIKSSNIIITDQGNLKVLDFGLAKRIRAMPVGGTSSSSSSSMNLGQIVGTIHYLAPEVLRGERANVRSDIWSLGVLLYEMATGTLPFRGKTVFELANAIMTSHAAPPAQKIPEWTAHVIARCLDRNLARRYRCARDLTMDLPVERNSGSAKAAKALTVRLDGMHTSPTDATARAVGAG